MKTRSLTLCIVRAVLSSMLVMLSASAADPPQAAASDSDRDGDGLTLAQELSLGTDPASPDSDGDGWEDGDEILNGRSPTNAQALDVLLPGIQAEIFDTPNGPDGKSARPALRAFAAGGGFAGRPQESRALSRLAFSDVEKDNFSSRIRVFVTAPQTGDYRFGVAGDDETELWLSMDDSPFQSRCIARSKWWTEYFDWSGHPSQQSGLIRLEAGHRYYLEGTSTLASLALWSSQYRDSNSGWLGLWATFPAPLGSISGIGQRRPKNNRPRRGRVS